MNKIGVILSSFILFSVFLSHPRITYSADLLPEHLNGFTESKRKVRCTSSAPKQEQALFVTIESIEDLECVELYLEMFGGLKTKEYREHIFEIQGKRYGEEIAVGFREGELIYGKKTPKLFPQLYVLLIRFSPSGQKEIQRLSDKYIEALAFRFETPELIKKEKLREGVLYEQFLQSTEVFSEGKGKTYTGQIFRIFAKNVLVILSGINLSEETWEEVLSEITPINVER